MSKTRILLNVVWVLAAVAVAVISAVENRWFMFGAWYIVSLLAVLNVSLDIYQAELDKLNKWNR